MTDSPFWLAKPVGKGRFTFKPTSHTCVGPDSHQFYMGGVAMATHIAALEQHFDKPLLWATIHFIHHGLLGEDMTLEVEAVSGGRSVVQAMAEMKRGDTVLHRTIAALGARDGEPDHAFVKMPDVPPPEACRSKQDDAMANDNNLLGLM